MVVRIALILFAVASLAASPGLGQEAAPAALPAASTAQDQGGNRDESTWPGAGAVELGLFQTAHGALVGIELCELAHCRTKQLPPYLWGGAGLGAVAGTLVGLKLRPHQAMLINSGTVLGFVHGVALTWDEQPRDAAKTWMLGQLVGTAVGAAAGQLWHPENGRLAMANSAALWTATTVGLARMAARRGSTPAWTIAAADLGFVFGLLAWDSKPLSRVRLAVVDVAAAAGLWLGGMVGAAVGRLGPRSNDFSLYGGAAAGAATGAILAATLVPAPEKPLSIQLIPQSNGLALVGAF